MVLLIASALGGGGVGAVLPKMVPHWYRDDPAYGEDLRKVQRDVDELRLDFHEFLREGPRKVRRNQERILEVLETIDGRLERIEKRE